MKLVPLFPDRSAAATPRKRSNKLLLAAVFLGVLASLLVGGLAAVRHYWPPARIELGSSALARVQIARYGEYVAAVSAVDSKGRPVRVTLRGGQIEPDQSLPGATKVTVTVTVRRSQWVGWLVGATEQVQTIVRTPATYLADQIVYPNPGKPVQVRFSSRVKVVSVRRPDGTNTQLTFRHPRRVVSIGILASGADSGGTALVAGAPRSWESLPDPVRVDWFPPGPTPQVLVRPARSSKIVPSAPIVLTFSRPVGELLGRVRPTLKPRVKGSWTLPNDHTLVFTPSGLGFPLGRRIHLRLPEPIDVISGADPSPFRTLTWQVPRPSPLRTKELLAELGYLPVEWTPAGHAVRLTPGAQARAAVAPPNGTFGWRYPQTPVALKGLWSSASGRPTLIRGAIMAFQDMHGMPVDGYPSLTVFRALVRDELAGRQARRGYSYVFVSESLPQTLTLWHAGQVILRTPVNTGISSRPTALGTYPVYAHLVATTMQGTNPDGSHYDDPGVPWVNYFNGGDAVHGFPRYGYGWPQSLGCVEAPIPTAGRIFPYVNIGTLVTVAA